MKGSIHLLLIAACLMILGCSEETSVAPAEEPLGYTRVGAPAQSLAEFEGVLERIRTDLRIPGFSAAITKERNIVWAKGFGYSNKENGTKATPETVYHLASLTKPFAAIVIMQLVEQNKLDLESPVSDFGIVMSSQGIIQVKHLLTHTSEGVPGASYQYNGERFSRLDSVITRTSGKSFCELLNQNILIPFHLTMTGPNPLVPNRWMQTSHLLAQFAQGYTSNGQHPTSYPTYFGTSAGLVSNVIDMSKLSLALDNDLLLRPETKKSMFAPAISNSGTELPYGLGWFVDNNEQATIIWHYGYWDAISTLIMKIPEKGLSFVILANSDRLSSSSSSIGMDEDVNRSVVAQEFLNAFVYGKARLPDQAVY